MAHSAVLIGNSSSAVYEAMSVGLPVVNIGDRQFGRENESVWINVGYNRQEIVDGIKAAMFDEAYRTSLRKYSSAMGAYNPEVQVAKILAGLDLSRSSHPKKFFDIVPEKG
jgi:UDP-N-acetylglucosamine 2-epimerase